MNTPNHPFFYLVFSSSFPFHVVPLAVNANHLLTFIYLLYFSIFQFFIFRARARLVHVKMLAHVAQTVGFSETNEQIIPLLSGLAVDSERAIKQHLTEQLSLLAKVNIMPH